MIGYLNGEVLEHSDGKLLVTVGDRQTSGAVGYLVSVPQNPAYASLGPGQRTELFIYTHVREDALDLFGFQTSSEKNLFCVLLEVNGIGPKSALNILSKVGLQQLI